MSEANSSATSDVDHDDREEHTITPEVESVKTELLKALNPRDAAALKALKKELSGKANRIRTGETDAAEQPVISDQDTVIGDEAAAAEDADEDADTNNDATGTEPGAELDKGEETTAKGGKFDRSKLAPDALKAFEGMEKAIHRLTGQKHEAREKLEAVTAERDQVRRDLDSARGTAKLEPTPESPLADVTTTEDVQKRMDNARSTVAWAKANRNGVILRGKNGEEVEYSPADVAEIREGAQDLVDRHGPSRLKWLSDREGSTHDARKAYPDLLKGENGKRREQLLRELPGLASKHDSDLIIGDMLLGEKVRKGQLVAFAKGAKPTNAPSGSANAQASITLRPPLSSSASPPQARPTGSKPDTSESLKRAAKSGRVEDMERHLAARFAE